MAKRIVPSQVHQLLKGVLLHPHHLCLKMMTTSARNVDNLVVKARSHATYVFT